MKQKTTGRIAEDTETDAAQWSKIFSHSDFRKYDDRLRLTADCSDEQVRIIEDILWTAARQSAVKFGIHVQTHAVITCVVPSECAPDAHLHFLDGFDGDTTVSVRPRDTFVDLVILDDFTTDQIAQELIHDGTILIA